MSEQPKALKLIGQLDEIAMYSSKSATWALDAVNELERLYAVNQELVEALTVLLKLHDNKVDIAEAWETSMEEARATLAKARGER